MIVTQGLPVIYKVTVMKYVGLKLEFGQKGILAKVRVVYNF